MLVRQHIFVSVEFEEGVIGTDKEIVGVVLVRGKLLNDPEFTSLSIIVYWCLSQKLTQVNLALKIL